MRKNSIDRIRRAVIRAVVESGVDGVRTKDIAKKAKTSESLLFKYYEDKRDLIKETFVELANEFYNYIKPKVESSNNKLDAFIDSFINFALSRKNEFLFILKMYQFHYEKFVKKTPKPIDILRQIAPEGKYGKQYTVAFIVSVLTRVLEFYVNGQISDSEENLRKNIKEVISYIL